MSDQNNNSVIGQAWGLHREDRNDEAIDTFRTVLNADGDDIDANYGIGLAYRASGNAEKAVTHMKRARQVVTRALLELREEQRREGVALADNLRTTLADRYMMLSRMTYQRLSEMGVDVELFDEEVF
ncbi:MAG: hypothetical protein EA396_09005 [Anaerolineaceae bacterium]|nr:MAG: hypothetical protein EA396_09005 [Anaerolineaceae bacterium]